MTKEELAKLFMDGMRAQQGKSYEKSIKIFTDYLSLVNDPDDLEVAYRYRGESYLYIGEREKGIADWKKAIDLGNEFLIDDLKTLGINYTPQKTSSSINTTRSTAASITIGSNDGNFVTGSSQQQKTQTPLSFSSSSGYEKGRWTQPSGMVYEGELFDGKRHGRGKLMDNKGKVVYDGEWVNGYRKN